MRQSEGRLHNQVAIVTGAAQGMGAAIAARLATEGAKVVLSDINTEKVAGVADRINAASTNGSALAMRTDVTKEDEVAEMVEATIEQYGTVSILINNAGILYPTRIDNVTKAEWDEVLDVNLNGSFLCSKAVLPIMKANKFGRIVNMSSSAGRSVSTLGGVHYTAAKAGVLGLTRGWRKRSRLLVLRSMRSVPDSSTPRWHGRTVPLNSYALMRKVSRFPDWEHPTKSHN